MSYIWQQCFNVVVMGRGVCPGGVYLGGVCPREVFAWGVCPEASARGVTARGGEGMSGQIPPADTPPVRWPLPRLIHILLEYLLV